jgi:hypothetical protein
MLAAIARRFAGSSQSGICTFGKRKSWAIVAIALLVLHNRLINMYDTLSAADRAFIDHVRGALILRVVLVHLGLSWFYLPYSSYVGAFFPALFCVSGIVSFYSFRRAPSTGSYLIKRLTRILITFYIISGLAYFVMFAIDPRFFSLSQLLNWLLVNPDVKDQPYPMGQIWFLRSLILLTIFVLPFFLLAKKNIHFLLIPISISLALAAAQQIDNVGPFFFLKIESLRAINLYQPLVNMGYFCFGAWACYSSNLHRVRVMFAMAAVGVAVAVSLYYIQQHSLDLTDHAYYQDLFYLSLGYAGIGIIFGLRLPIVVFIARYNFFHNVFSFFSYHAFSIFMIHSFFVYFSEEFFGWRDLGSVSLITLKIIFVVIASSLSAIPLSFVCKKITNWLVRHMEAHAVRGLDKHMIKTK